MERKCRDTGPTEHEARSEKGKAAELAGSDRSFRNEMKGAVCVQLMTGARQPRRVINGRYGGDDASVHVPEAAKSG